MNRWSKEAMDDSNLTNVMGVMEGLIYELRNCVKGVYTNATTHAELAEYLRNLASDLQDAADSLEEIEDDAEEEEDE